MPAKLQKWYYDNIWNPHENGDSRSSTSSDISISGQFAEFLKAQIGGGSVSITGAQKIAAVYTALNIRSQTIASLPINIFEEDGGKKKNLIDHPAYYPLAHEPNSYMSSANMFLTSMLHADSNGNSYIYIYRDGRTRPKSFEIMLPNDVSVKIVDGKAFYGWKGEIIPSRDVLHFRWFSLDGLCGISPILQNQMTMGSAVAQEKYAGIALSERPPGFLKYEGNMTEPQRAQNQKSWKEDRANGRVPILSGNWDWKSVLISPGDAEYILSKKLTKQEIYGIWRIPPIFAQDYERATFANAEQSDLIFAKHTVTPICRVIEQECNMKLFTEAEKNNTYVKFNMNGLLRGDLKARQEFYTAMRNTGAMNADEIRSLEDLNPYKGGDIYTVQSSNIPVDQLRKFYEQKVAPTAAPGGNGSAREIDAYEHSNN